MNTRHRHPLIVLGLLGLIGTSPGAFAQSEELPGSEEARAEAADEEYRPLFTPEMIENADPAQAERMRATERRNREAFEERQRARQRSAASDASARAEPPPRRSRKKKIYRWVDKNGNVNFGDAPGGSGAVEIEVGGAARQRGQAPPPPSLVGGER